MNQRWLLILPVVATAAVAVWLGMADRWSGIAATVVALVGAALVGAALIWRSTKRGSASGTGTVSLVIDPQRLEKQRHNITEELALLEEAQELQRGVFEVSAELVGCVDEADARYRFAAAMRRYWSCSAVDLMVWEKGSWRGMGGPISGDLPVLSGPVQLPNQPGGDLVLDLSPGVDGQAALVLRQAKQQPSLTGRSSADQRYVAEVLRTQLSLSLRRVVLYAGLQSLARLDPLTSAHRRWYGETRLSELCEAGEVVAVAMVDIDHFKSINDGFGHAAGDQVLAAVGRALTTHLRTGDLVSRQGGEEFLVILPDTPPVGAMQVAERLREAVAALTGLPKTVTVSIGVAACLQDETAANLVARADTALYRAKSSGRNQVILAYDGGTEGYLRTTARRAKKATNTDTAAYRSMNETTSSPIERNKTDGLG
jgi:diguanylate cyclase (GGDEF)-like protein